MSPQHVQTVPPRLDKETARAIQNIEDLVARLESGHDPQTRDLARELTKALLALHRQGLARLMALLSEGGEAEQPIRAAWLADPLISHLLMLHDLHPVDLELRVGQALDAVRPQLQAHGGDVALLGLADCTLDLQLSGKCDGCASSMATMQQLVLDALCEAAPDVAAVRWTIAPAAPKLTPLTIVPL